MTVEDIFQEFGFWAGVSVMAFPLIVQMISLWLNSRKLAQEARKNEIQRDDEHRRNEEAHIEANRRFIQDRAKRADELENTLRDLTTTYFRQVDEVNVLIKELNQHKEDQIIQNARLDKMSKMIKALQRDRRKIKNELRLTKEDNQLLTSRYLELLQKVEGQ